MNYFPHPDHCAVVISLLFYFLGCERGNGRMCGCLFVLKHDMVSFIYFYFFKLISPSRPLCCCDIKKDLLFDFLGCERGNGRMRGSLLVQ